MQGKQLSAVLAATALFSALAASAAQAACGSRPGTPNEVKAEPLAGGTIRFSWRNTTGKGMNKSGSTSIDPKHKMWFDISVRDGKGNQVGKDMGGHGPFDVAYGHRSHQDFTGLSVPSTFCFKIRARTEGGTKGCVSQIFSAQVCATTTASAPPPSTRPAKPLGAPVIAASRESGNVFYVRGFRFQPNASVTIRAVDGATLQGALITSIGGNRMASANGLMGMRLYGICSKAQGPIHFSANDGRSNRADKTGTLWSNTVTVACQR